jgi:hypothetical protein
VSRIRRPHVRVGHPHRSAFQGQPGGNDFPDDLIPQVTGNFAYLASDNPDYPEKILAAAQAQVRHRLARMQSYRDVEVSEADIHLWQQCNPVVTAP